MTDQWKEKGCSICRTQWERGDRPALVAESTYLHSRLYQCRSCACYWEESERYADTITAREAEIRYPEAFPPPSGNDRKKSS